MKFPKLMLSSSLAMVCGLAAAASLPAIDIERAVTACAARTATHIFGIQGISIDQSSTNKDGELAIQGHFYNKLLVGGVGETPFNFIATAAKSASGEFQIKVSQCD